MFRFITKWPNRLVLTIGLITAPALSYGVNFVDEGINESSFTQTADSFVNISSFPNDSLIDVVVSSASPGAVMTLFDGTNPPFISTIGIINLNAVQNPFYYVEVDSGISYNITGTPTNGVCIIYRNRKIGISRGI